MTNVQIIGHNYRNSYEQSVTSLGDVFQNDNDDPPACRVSNTRLASRNCWPSSGLRMKGSVSSPEPSSARSVSSRAASP